MLKKRPLLALLLFLLVPLVLGFFSSMIAGNVNEIYNTLNRPPLAPTSWLFSVIWAILYILIGLAAYFVYESDAKPRKKNRALIFFAVQLFVNLIWTPIFFANFWVAFVVIIILDLLAIYTMMLFMEIRRSSMYLMVPYFIWLLFVTYLNFGFALIN